MTAQTAADLRAAAEVLRRDGWTQGVFRDPTSGARCADGVLEYIAGDDTRRYCDSAQSVMALIGDGLIKWNDAPGRTAAEVIAALEAAAAAEEARP